MLTSYAENQCFTPFELSRIAANGSLIRDTVFGAAVLVISSWIFYTGWDTETVVKDFCAVWEHVKREEDHE